MADHIDDLIADVSPDGVVEKSVDLIGVPGIDMPSQVKPATIAGFDLAAADEGGVPPSQVDSAAGIFTTEPNHDYAPVFDESYESSLFDESPDSSASSSLFDEEPLFPDLDLFINVGSDSGYDDAVNEYNLALERYKEADKAYHRAVDDLMDLLKRYEMRASASNMVTLIEVKAKALGLSLKINSYEGSLLPKLANKHTEAMQAKDRVEKALDKMEDTSKEAMVVACAYNQALLEYNYSLPNQTPKMEEFNRGLEKLLQSCGPYKTEALKVIQGYDLIDPKGTPADEKALGELWAHFNIKESQARTAEKAVKDKFSIFDKEVREYKELSKDVKAAKDAIELEMKKYKEMVSSIGVYKHAQIDLQEGLQEVKSKADACARAKSTLDEWSRKVEGAEAVEVSFREAEIARAKSALDDLNRQLRELDGILQDISSEKNDDS